MLAWLQNLKKNLQAKLPASPLNVAVLPIASVLYPGSVRRFVVEEAQQVAMLKRQFEHQRAIVVSQLSAPDTAGVVCEVERVGCLARITAWQALDLGCAVDVQGLQRVKVRKQTRSEQLVLAQVDLMAEPEAVALAPEHRACSQFLRTVHERQQEAGTASAQPVPEYDDPAYVSYRLAELLPLREIVRQKLLELDDPNLRLQVLGQYLKRERLIFE